MSLTTRLSAFFLTALAVVLIGFSTAIYALARFHLNRQLDDRVRANLETLTASVEVEHPWLEYDPNQRWTRFGEETSELAWGIFDKDEGWVDGSPRWQEMLTAIIGHSPIKHFDVDDIHWKEQTWRVASRTLEIMGSRNLVHPELDPEPGKKKYPLLVLVIGVPRTPLQSELRKLSWTLSGLSLLVWVCSAVAGRWMCQWALSPLTRMAGAARAIGANELEQRLPVSATKDELEALGRAFNGLLGRVHDAFERQQRFTGEASHQLRTPLTGLLGQVEIALRRERGVEEYQRVLQSVQKQSIQLEQIVEMLLFLARPDAEARIPNLSQLDLRDWLSEHLTSWSDHARWVDIQVIVPRIAQIARVHAVLLGQALDNLLDNACKYSETGTPIVVRLVEEQNEVVILVEDQGIGILPEDLPRVGEPFFRAGLVRQRGINGVGLGCSVAARVARALSGRFDVESIPGQGSRIAIRLPRIRRDEDECDDRFRRLS